MASDARAKVNLSHDLFKAYSKWVHNFKNQHRIVSRKINKFVIQTKLRKKDDLKQIADEFVQKVESNFTYWFL